jgi:ABC-type dipeptide/oligopeptide/nickel transport system permease subunit
MANDISKNNDPVGIREWEETAPRYSEMRRMISVFAGRPLPVIGFVIIALLILMALLAPLIAPYPPNQIDFPNKLLQPSSAHWLGTDSLGRDTLSRIIYGSRSSLIVGITVMIISSVIGIVLGLMAAYFGGWVNAIIMRFMDALMAFPMLLLALLVATLLGAGMLNVIIALGIGMISAPCRLMSALFLSVKQNDYILAGRAMGMSNQRLMFQEILPNAFPPLLVLITVGLGAVILAEAGLSFLGIGITPPTATWGGLVNDGYKFLLTNPVLAISPGVAIMLAVFGFNMLGDGLRDALDPKLRGVI